MTAQLDEGLAVAALTDAERRTLVRLIERLREELGEHLLAVWLYGSRARGDADPYETDLERKSDIDLMLILDQAAGWGAYAFEAVAFVNEATEAEGEDPFLYSVRAYDSERLRDRREIRAFFIQNVDRDKLVLYGSGME